MLVSFGLWAAGWAVSSRALSINRGHRRAGCSIRLRASQHWSQPTHKGNEAGRSLASIGTQGCAIRGRIANGYDGPYYYD